MIADIAIWSGWFAGACLMAIGFYAVLYSLRPGLEFNKATSDLGKAMKKKPAANGPPKDVCDCPAGACGHLWRTQAKGKFETFDGGRGGGFGGKPDDFDGYMVIEHCQFCTARRAFIARIDDDNRKIVDMHYAKSHLGLDGPKPQKKGKRK